MIVPLIVYVFLVPFWLRNLSAVAKVRATILYVLATTAILVGTVMFVLLYGNCLENCYATNRDEIAIVTSGVLIVAYLVGVYWACNSYNKRMQSVAAEPRR